MTARTITLPLAREFWPKVLLAAGLCILAASMSYGATSTIGEPEKAEITPPDSTNAGIQFYKTPGTMIYTVKLDQPSQEMTDIWFRDKNGVVQIHSEFMEDDTHVLDLDGLDPGDYLVVIKSGEEKLTQLIKVKY